MQLFYPGKLHSYVTEYIEIIPLSAMVIRSSRCMQCMKGIICKHNERLKYSEQGTDETGKYKLVW
jgi:hypothetical protein